MDVIGASYKPKLDGNGGVTFVPAGDRTVDFEKLAERFRDFGLNLDKAAIKDLNRIRNEIEYYYTNASPQVVREAIAKAFPVVSDLFALADENPALMLGDAWGAMLEVKETYERELAACRATFAPVEWDSSTLAAATFNCTECHSDLVAQADPTNTAQEGVDCVCRACGASMEAGAAIEHALQLHLDDEVYRSAKDGGESPLDACPECARETYLQYDDENACAACGFALEERCASCGTPLTPNDAWVENRDLCSYCGYKMSKDD